MGTVYREAWKNITGKPEVTAYDVLSLGASSVSGVVGATSLADSFGVASHTLPRPGRLDGAVVNVDPAPGMGKLSVRLLVDGAQVASGDLVADGSLAYIDLPQETKLGTKIALADGAVLSAEYSVEGLLSLGIPHGVSTRIHLTLEGDA